MTWAEIERLPQTRQHFSQMMASAHLTMIEGSHVTVLETFDFILGEAPILGPGKPLEE
jgi:hypothetical protein